MHENWTGANTNHTAPPQHIQAMATTTRVICPRVNNRCREKKHRNPTTDLVTEANTLGELKSM